MARMFGSGDDTQIAAATFADRERCVFMRAHDGNADSSLPYQATVEAFAIVGTHEHAALTISKGRGGNLRVVAGSEHACHVNVVDLQPHSGPESVRSSREDCPC